MNRQLNRFAISGAAAGLLLLCTAPAEAYVGPGAGLSLLGALWALIAAIAAVVAFIVLWPFRKAMQRRAVRKKAAMAASQPFLADSAAACETAPEATHETPEAPAR